MLQYLTVDGTVISPAFILLPHKYCPISVKTLSFNAATRSKLKIYSISQRAQF